MHRTEVPRDGTIVATAQAAVHHKRRLRHVELKCVVRFAPAALAVLRNPRKASAWGSLPRGDRRWRVARRP